jgi:hypothetical protein
MALETIATYFHAEVVTFFINVVMYFSQNGRKQWNPSVVLVDYGFTLALYSNFITMICVTILIFVSWQKGSQCWQRAAPKVFFMLILMNFIIVPGINITYQVFIAAYPPVIARESYWESFLVFFMVACCAKPIQYFFIVKKSFVIDARAYIANRELV